MSLLIFTVILVAISFSLFCLAPSNIFKFMDNTYTDILKGLSVLLVVLSHMAGKFGVRYFTPFGGIGVAIFLICSAYGLSASYDKHALRNFWIKKIKKVWLPYALLQTSIAIYQLIIRKPVTLSAYLMDLTLLNTTHPFGWYLQVLFVWYTLFYLSNLLIKNENFKLTVLFIASICFLLIPNELWAEQAFSFFFGILLYKLTTAKTKQELLSNKLLPWGLIAIGLLFLVFKQMTFVRDLNPFYYNIVQLLLKLPIAFGLVLIIPSFKWIFKNKFFTYLGSLSFEIYLIHAYTIEILESPSYLNLVFFLLTTAIFVTFYHNISNLIIKGLPHT